MLNQAVTTSPVPTFPANLRYIQDGDALNTTNHQLQAQDIADAVGHLKGSLSPTGDIVQRGITVNSDAGTTGLAHLISVAATESAIQMIDLPNGVELTDVTVYVDRSDTGLTPGTKVEVQLIRVEISTGTATTLGTYTDTTTPISPNYEARHAVTLSGLSVTIDNTQYAYYTRLVGETGADSTTVLWGGCITTIA